MARTGNGSEQTWLGAAVAILMIIGVSFVIVSVPMAEKDSIFPFAVIIGNALRYVGIGAIVTAIIVLIRGRASRAGYTHDRLNDRGHR